MHRLIIRQRAVPSGQVGTYVASWRELVRDAEAAGARAWAFRAVADHELVTEFIEWRHTADGAATNEAIDEAIVRAIATASQALENIATAVAERTWEEWTPE